MEQSDIRRTGGNTVAERVGEEGLSQPALVFRDGHKPIELFSVDDGEIECCLRALMQEQGFSSPASVHKKSERTGGSSEDCFDVRYLLFDEGD